MNEKLYSYVNQRLAQGATREMIITELQNKGWSEQDVIQTIDSIKTQQSTVASSVPNANPANGSGMVANNPMNTNQTIRYAGFWLRLFAFLVDGLILGVVNMILVAVFPASELGSFSIAYLIMLVISLLYYPLLESSKMQATIGKYILGLKVTNMDGTRISVAIGFGRYLSKILSTVILFIGYIMIAFTEKKQGLHDMIVKTLVVKK